MTMEGVRATYPARPGEPDCLYYLNHGLCSYGPRCRFNHPPLSSNLSADQVNYQLPKRPGQPDCQYYMKTGACKFGAACKYNHPGERVRSPVQLNFSGLPMRPGEKECMYYASTGACKFGLNCKFHHPQPGENYTSTVIIPSPPMYTLSAYRSLNSTVSCHGIPGAYIVARGSYLSGAGITPSTNYSPIVLSPQWPFKGPYSPKTPLEGIEQSPRATNNAMHEKADSVMITLKSRASAVSGGEFPQREGQPECQYYLKTGDCRFGAFCKFHHPKVRTARMPPSDSRFSSLGLPLRPGEPYCSYYRQHGICRFGPVCKFDHPIFVPLHNAMGVAPIFDSWQIIGRTHGSPAANISFATNSFVNSVYAAEQQLPKVEEVQQDTNITVSAHEESEDSTQTN